jgi:hypothetical protein
MAEYAEGNNMLGAPNISQMQQTPPREAGFFDSAHKSTHYCSKSQQEIYNIMTNLNLDMLFVT